MKSFKSLAGALTASAALTACSNSYLGNQILTDHVINGVSNRQRTMVASVMHSILDENKPELDDALLSRMSVEGMQPFFDAVMEKDRFSKIYVELPEKQEPLQLPMNNFYGIAFGFTSTTNHYIITKVLAGSLAEKAGLKAGDYVEFVGGIDLSTVSTHRLGELLNGIKGKNIAVQIYRSGEGVSTKNIILQQSVGMTPPPIELDTATSDISKNVEFGYFPDQQVGYIKILSFEDERIGETVLMGVRDALLKHDLHTFVIDLRDNPGGRVVEANEVLSVFLKNTKTFTTTYRLSNAHTQEFYADPTFHDGDAAKMKVVLLGNRDTASAAEILIQVLKELYPDTIYMGEKTFGKGIVQSTAKVTLPLGIDSSGKTIEGEANVKTTTGEWYSAHGKNVGNPLRPKPEDGIKPDIQQKLPYERLDLVQMYDTALAVAIYKAAAMDISNFSFPFRFVSLSFQGTVAHHSIASSIVAQ